MNDSPAPRYGTTRHRRASVSFAEMERAASALMKAGQKPGLLNLRQALGGGSPETLRNMLKRYWHDLAARLEGPAPALLRVPSDVADLADELWQRALALAGEAATNNDNAARERLNQIGRENELRSHALSLKEKEFQERARLQEIALQDLREQNRALLTLLSRNQQTLSSLQTSKTAYETQMESHRRQLATVLTRVVTRSKVTLKNKPTGRVTAKTRLKSGRKLKPEVRTKKRKS